MAEPKRAPMPATIVVGPMRYSVECDEAAVNAASFEAQSALLGQCDHRGLKIVIRPTLAPDQLADTLLHEVLHAVSCMVGIQADRSTDDEEAIVNRLAPALLDVMRRNPGLVAFLLDDT